MKRKTPFYIMRHPFEGFAELQYHHWDSPLVATITIFALFAALIINRQLSGFSFSINTRLEDLNVPLILVQSVGICTGFALVNWSICTLFDGNGKIRDVWVVLGYSLTPYVLALLFVTLLSRFLTVEEAVFLNAIEAIAMAYSLFLILNGLGTYHEYSFLRATFSTVFTLFGMVLVVLVFILLFSISQQFVAFIVTIYQELSLRR
ncbi:MAG: Yip1 family protein [Oscillospiraceae bacterium]|nr:Yip1 family protein [Oscillospiraceae bacterium]